jgi:hypothetical protein
MQCARKTITADPFVIYNYYELLGTVMKDLNIEERTDVVQESFNQDPLKGKVICKLGDKALRVTHGASRENTTISTVYTSTPLEFRFVYVSC